VPDVIDDGLINDLRRYGAAVEAMAERYASPPDYPVAPAPRSPASGDAPAPGGRRTAVLVGAAAVVLLVVIAAVALVRRSDPTPPVVDTPPTTAEVPSAQPFDDGTVLMWLPYEGPPQYLAQFADRPEPVVIGDPPQPGRSAIVTVNNTAGFLVQGSLFLVDRAGVVTATGVAGDRVLANRGDAGDFYVLQSRQLSLFRQLAGRVIDTWTLPEGWQLPTFSSSNEVLDGQVVLERIDPNAAVHDIALWTPGTGELEPIGRARWVVDATVYPNGLPIVAWLDDDCDRLSTGCGLVITNLATMESRTVARPEHGFIGGGAFSDDGRHLAAFVAGQANMPVDPSADLAVVDVGTLAMRVLPGTNVAVGEPIGSAAWTADGSSVIFHGLSETHVVDVTTGTQRTLPWEITYSMATIP